MKIASLPHSNSLHHHQQNHQNQHHNVTSHNAQSTAGAKATNAIAANASAAPAKSQASSSGTLFSEQVGHVIELFKDWNDCERSVSLFAVLKRIPFSCTKFLQSVIDANLTLAYESEKSKQLDRNANSSEYVRALHEAYRMLEVGSHSSINSRLSNKDSLFGELDDGQRPRRGSTDTNAQTSSGTMTTSTTTTTTTTRTAAVANNQRYDKKEDILGDILNLMPILTPGNEEAKCAYLELIPATVEDAIRGTVNTSLVQQIFSYVLIHPAFSVEDRRSLNKVLRHFEDHIVRSDPNFILFPASPSTTAADSGTAATSTTHSTATLSSASAPHIASNSGNSSAHDQHHQRHQQQHRNSWQAIAPPTSGGSAGASSKSSETIHSSAWDSACAVSRKLSSSSSAKMPGVGLNGGSTAPQHKASSNPATLNGGSVIDFLQPAAAALLCSSVTAIGQLGSPATVASQSVAVGVGTATPSPSIFGAGEPEVIGANSSSSGTDDHHISFSKNGTEIIDFEPDDSDKSNTQIGYDTLANLNDFLAVPGGGIMDCVTLKTRRSNSLTTAAAAGCRLGSIGAGGLREGGGGGGDGGSVTGTIGAAIGNSGGSCNVFGNSLTAAAAYGVHSGSAQNLTHLMLQKPRSFSLSMASPRGMGLTSSGSDTRLDDFRMVMQHHQNQQQQHLLLQQQQQPLLSAANNSPFNGGAPGCSLSAGASGFANYAGSEATPSPSATGVSLTHHVGMSNIGQWLKSLRLHKYVYLFSSITYEQMLAISEEYLQQLSVTKGARHKLVVCIQRLKERHALLGQMEKDLMLGRTTLATALEELTGVALTPMRPVEPYNKQDVGGQFLRVLNLISNMVINKHITAQDEEPVNTLLWILDKSVHNEAFVAHTNQLKEHRFKVARIKAQFPPKPHFVPAIVANAQAAGSTLPSSSASSASSSSCALSAVSGQSLGGGVSPSAHSVSSGGGGATASAVGSAQSSNEVAIAGNLTRSRYETKTPGALAEEQTPTSSIAPWRCHWPVVVQPPTVSASTNTNRLAQSHHHQLKGHSQLNHDSDYHSMTSSQSNSTESLDQILCAASASAFVDKLCFDRVISKPSPKLEPGAITPNTNRAMRNDFLSTPLTQLPFAGLQLNSAVRRASSSGLPSSGGSCREVADEADDMKPDLCGYLRRESFNGLTDIAKAYATPSPLPVAPANFKLSPIGSAQAAMSANQFWPNNSRTVLRRQSTAITTPNAPALPNMRVPPPNYTPNYSYSPPAEIPVFDATKPPPMFVPRAVQMKTSALNIERSRASAVAQATPAVEPEPSVELYRPREMRQTPLQNLQPASNISNGIVRTPLSSMQFERPPQKRHPPTTSKIVANFSVSPIVHIVGPSPPNSNEFPSLKAPFAKVPKTIEAEPMTEQTSERYIVKQTPTTAAAATDVVYRTPSNYSTVPVVQQSLASIVRTTLPKLMQQQQQQQPVKSAEKIKPIGAVPSPASNGYGGDDDGLGMSNVNSWLKSLRLHKYQWLFAKMTYRQMLAIDDAYLESQQITKGARNKLVLSVQRLNERFDTMDRIEKDLQTGDVQSAQSLDELIAVAQSPMRPMQPFVPQDVATKLMKVLNLVYEKFTRSLLVHPDEQFTGKFTWLLEAAGHSEGCAAFQTQLRRMRQRIGSDRKSSQYQR